MSLNLLFCLISTFNLKEQGIVKDACKSYKDSNYKTLLEEINACLKIYYESLKERFKESSFSKKNKSNSNQDNQSDTAWNLTNILYDFIHKMIEQLINDQKINDLKIKTKLFACNIDRILMTKKLIEKLDFSKLVSNFPMIVSDMYLEMHSNAIKNLIENLIDIKIKELPKKFIAMK